MELKRFVPCSLFVLYICVCISPVHCIDDDEEIPEDDDFGTAGMYHAPAWTSDGQDIRYSSEEEEIFYFFEDHDQDENMKIDGLELLKAMYHAELEEIDSMEITPEKKENAHRHTSKWRIRRMSALVDKALQFDANSDGYFDWPEFKDAAKRLHLVKVD